MTSMSTDAVSDPDAALRQPSLFIPHGGGPCFFMDPADPDRVQCDPMWQPMQPPTPGAPTRPASETPFGFFNTFPCGLYFT